MKEKIKRISSSTWALILALMMVVSSFSVLAATTNVNKTGALVSVSLLIRHCMLILVTLGNPTLKAILMCHMLHSHTAQVIVI